jgi:hypothetical protein
MSYLRCLCLFANSGVQRILCCVFLRIVCLVLPVSLDCLSLITPSVLSNFYLQSSRFPLSVNKYFQTYCQKNYDYLNEFPSFQFVSWLNPEVKF